MAKFKSVDFNKIKSALVEETKKSEEGFTANPLIFKPARVKGEEKTKFRLRFLPVAESRIGKPWMEVRYHMFERDGDNKFCKVIDPKTFSRDAKNPISEHATKLWNSDNALDKERAKKLFSKQRYFTLVYVKEAPENQKECVGKVMIWEIGKQIFDILDAAIREYEKCFWDPFKGQDFLLVIKGKGGENDWPDYTQSNWIGDGAAITDDETQMDKIATELETVTIKVNIIDKDGVKTAAEMEDLMNGGLKNASKNASEGENFSKPAEKVVEKASSKAKPDFGDTNTAAASTKKAETPKAPPAATKPAVAKEEPAAEPDAAVMDFDVNLNDIDIKF